MKHIGTYHMGQASVQELLSSSSIPYDIPWRCCLNSLILQEEETEKVKLDPGSQAKGAESQCQEAYKVSLRARWTVWVSPAPLRAPAIMPRQLTYLLYSEAAQMSGLHGNPSNRVRQGTTGQTQVCWLSAHLHCLHFSAGGQKSSSRLLELLGLCWWLWSVYTRNQSSVKAISHHSCPVTSTLQTPIYTSTKW